MEEFRKNISIRWFNEARKVIPLEGMNPSDDDLKNYSLDKMVDLAKG
jgi:hypothetical protein